MRRQTTIRRGRVPALAERMAIRKFRGGLRRRRASIRASIGGYTLIEAIVAAALITIGVVAVFGGLRALSKAQAKAKTADLLQRLALEEFNQIGAIEDPTTAATGGDFGEIGYPNITWTVDIETTQVTNLDQVTVKATLVNGAENEQQSVVGLLYVPATTTTTTGGAAGTGGTGQ